MCLPPEATDEIDKALVDIRERNKTISLVHEPFQELGIATCDAKTPKWLMLAALEFF
ncbi:MAG TPA: hypothetical protein VKC60_05525 [Opitutaceae bacterium]|nr:hypothetical protein [Opitutaceae bacterium]